MATTNAVSGFSVALTARPSDEDSYDVSASLQTASIMQIIQKVIQTQPQFSGCDVRKDIVDMNISLQRAGHIELASDWRGRSFSKIFGHTVSFPVAICAAPPQTLGEYKRLYLPVNVTVCLRNKKKLHFTTAYQLPSLCFDT